MIIKRRTMTKFLAVVTVFWFYFIVKYTTTNTTKCHLSASALRTRRNSNVSVQISEQLKSTSILVNSTNFRHALSLRADTDRYIILAMTDKGFIDMAINFYETSLRAHHIDNFLFVGIGENSCEILTNTSIPCYYYADDPSASKSSDYGGREFDRKLRIRTNMIIDALEANYTVIHCDTDVVFLRNPMPHLKVNTVVVSTSVDFFCSI